MDQDAALRELSQHVQAKRPDALLSADIAVGQLTLITDAAHVLDLLTFLQCAVSLPANLPEVNEYIFAPVSLNEAISLGVVEPFHLADLTL